MTAVYDWIGDLFLAVVATLLAAGAVVTGLSGPVRILALLPVVLFLPGYAFVSALFPEGTTESRSLRTLNRATLADPTGEEYRGIGTAERIALSIAVSLAVLPLTAFVLNFTPLGISTVPLVAILTGFTVVFALVALLRRKLIDPDDRYGLGSLAPAGTFAAVGGGKYGLLFVAALVLLATSAGAVSFTNPADDQFTEFYLVTEQDGEVTTENVGATARDGGTIQVAIANGEGRQMSYTTVVQVEQVQNGQVTGAKTVDTFQTSVAAGETKRTDYQVSQSGGDNSRLAFLLYKGAPPENPSRENADVVVHVWLSSQSGQQALAAPTSLGGST